MSICFHIKIIEIAHKFYYPTNIHIHIYICQRNTDRIMNTQLSIHIWTSIYISGPA